MKPSSMKSVYFKSALAASVFLFIWVFTLWILHGRVVGFWNFLIAAAAASIICGLAGGVLSAVMWKYEQLKADEARAEHETPRLDDVRHDRQ
ncbi:MAG: hypothetical protein JJU18_04425 [Oceanicaulis sp.]|nr:hypothetical protein [Oceanicaulis sp.]